MVVISKTVNRDVALNTEPLKGVTFNRENKGHKFVISCMRGGALETVTGTVVAYFMRANNTTCRIDGEGFSGIDGDGRAWVVLPQDCYNVAGRFKLSVYVSHDGTSECIYACIGTVERSDVGEVIDSGVTLPSYDDIADMYQEMETARQACIDAAESVNGAVRYDETQSLTDSQKAQARENIAAASENELTSAVTNMSGYVTEMMATAVKFIPQNKTEEQKAQARANINAANADDISDLKSAIGTIDSTIFTFSDIPLYASPSSNWTLTGSGGSRQYTGNSLCKYAVTAGQKVYLKIAKDWSTSTDSQGVYQWQSNASVPGNDDNQYLVGAPVTSAVDGIVTVPTGATFLIVAQKSSNTTNQVKSVTETWNAAIDQLEDGIEEFEQDIQTTTDIPTATSPSSGWTLTGNGGCRSYSGNSLYKYAVTAGNTLYLKLAKDWSTSSDSQGVYQWQNSSSVPANNTNKYLIGTPVTSAIDGIVTVPTGATYLIVSQKSDNTTNKVQKISYKWDADIARLDSEIDNTGRDVFALSLNDNFRRCNVSAHAGASNAVYAINSMPGFKNAIAHGDRMLECDVRITSDGVPVLFHDETLKSSNIADYTGDPVYVGALTYAQTQAYNLPKSSGKIPRLLDALLLCKKHGVILEIDLAGKTWKSDASTTIMTQAQALQTVLDVIDACEMRKNVFLTIEYSGSTSQVSALIPITTDIAIGVSNRTSASSISAIESVISTFPLVICSIGENYTDSDLMTAIKNAGENCKAKAYTLNTSADIDAAINAGVAYCLSNVVTQDVYDGYTLS